MAIFGELGMGSVVGPFLGACGHQGPRRLPLFVRRLAQQTQMLRRTEVMEDTDFYPGSGHMVRKPYSCWSLCLVDGAYKAGRVAARPRKGAGDPFPVLSSLSPSTFFSPNVFPFSSPPLYLAWASFYSVRGHHKWLETVFRRLHIQWNICHIPTALSVGACVFFSRARERTHVPS